MSDSVSTEPFRLEFDADGVLELRGDAGWRMPNCAVCGGQIRWCLDMFSFTTGPYPHRLAHARCVWLPEAFEQEAAAAGSGGSGAGR